jgi:hypothetical protein
MKRRGRRAPVTSSEVASRAFERMMELEGPAQTSSEIARRALELKESLPPKDESAPSLYDFGECRVEE